MTSRGLPSDDNGDPEGEIFLSYPHTNKGFYFHSHHCYFLFILK